MAREALFLNMTPDKKRILFLGDGLPVMAALAQYARTVPAMLERYDCLGAFEYDNVSLMPPTTATTIRSRSRSATRTKRANSMRRRMHLWST